MRLNKILLLILIIYGVAVSQWTWQNPSVQNNNINDFWFLSDSYIIAVGEVGTIIKSSNGGVNWEVSHVTSGFFDEFKSIVFNNMGEGFICGQNGLIIKSTNGGNSWFSLSSPTNKYLYRIFYYPPSNYWISGENGTILYSSDGNNFIAQNSGTLKNINNIISTDGNTCYAVAEEGILLKTTNRGLNWNKILLPTQQTLNGVYFPSSSVGYIVGDSGKVFKTTNSGIIWSKIGVFDTLVVTSSDLKSVYFLDENRGWIAGKEARIFYTSNGGLLPSDWTYQNVSPYWRKILTLKFFNSSFGLAVGEWGTILRTTNGGQYWAVINNGCDEILNKIWFSSPNIGWVVGDRGTILKTTNGGSLWFTVPVFNYWHEKMTADINSIQFLDNENGFAIGDSSYFSYTTNGGSVWFFYHYDSLDRMKDLQGIHFLDNYNGVVVGGYYNSNPVFLRTADRGQSWHILKPSDAGYKNVPVSVKMLNYNEGWASCKEGILRYTTDGGYTWRYTQPLPSYGNDYNDIFFLPADSVGWTIGKNGLLLKTTNKGLTWFKQETQSNKELLSIFFANRNVGFIVGEVGLILKTTDGGNSWNVLQKTTNYRLKSVYMKSEQLIWITGEYGIILRSTDGGTSFRDFSEIIPRSIILKQNYPNPFNSTTKIEFTLDNYALVSLKLYNILGEEIHSLADRYFEKGTHTLIFNSDELRNKLAGGIYFFRLSAGNSVSVIKAVLLN